ncbi:LptE family protein [Myroides ceti]|uniref:LptE family protein n=1 Tax=Paenimyroides ceti TaxID=395087 RepID=A0ABT8CX15_9FLAO|nr:LptE family protein [Paenimyroides ceti]MDN3708306.1 LptE family protein [Paenimyroides ceti]MDN3709084.1 LptE family protein [Paenimyroides ceti]
MIYKILKKYQPLALILFFSLLLNSCSVYNFTGTGKIDAVSFQVNNFLNNATLVEPGIERTFTVALQDLIQNQTVLTLTNTNADLVYEGEITEYRISPMTATADQTAAQNRLYISIRVRFTNKNKPEDDFEQSFSHFYDYPANEQLIGARLNGAIDEIYERITQDVFNASLAKW